MNTSHTNFSRQPIKAVQDNFFQETALTTMNLKEKTSWDRSTKILPGEKSVP